ncbi:TetR/AcrR family transcriptional regulator [Amycolatopsis methanolica]|uniref:TetR/AcrR family transcriptional regulator n=1 Tax=Amycolatopsis methanolica TaxID=1814 RepID=UPI0034475957
MLPLRERKKLRTRQALAETAVAMFTERGFDAITLDELVDAVEVSQPTFFRNLSSKEDVALTAIKQLWETYLGVLAEQPRSGPLPGVLTEGCAALHAHSLRYCAEVKSEIVRVLGGRPDLQLRLLVEVVIGTWNCALAEWSPSGERDLLPVLVNRAFDTLPAALALE